MKKSNFFNVLVIALSFFLCFSFVSAHEDEADGSIIATMHIEPADSPAANSTSTLEFIFEDSTGRFNLDQCKCSLSIIQGTSTIYNSDLKGLYLPFVFPQKGPYVIDLVGQPIVDDQFSDFDLKFNTSVNRNAGDEISLWDRLKNSHFFHEGHWAHIVIFGAGFGICIYVILTDKKEDKV